MGDPWEHKNGLFVGEAFGQGGVEGQVARRGIREGELKETCLAGRKRGQKIGAADGSSGQAEKSVVSVLTPLSRGK